MKVLTQEVKNFLLHSSCVQANKQFPDLEAIKIEARKDKTLFTKSNNYIFCEYEYSVIGEQPEEVFLIPEKTLQGVAEICNQSSFSISMEKNSVQITYGDKFTRVSIQNISRFPQTPTPVNGKTDFSMSRKLVESIQVASKHMSRLPNKTIYSYVHVNEKGIFATDGGFTYYNSCGKGLPEIFFDDNVIAAISAIENMQYIDAGNYDMFLNESLLYAFIKNEYKTFDYSPFLNIPTDKFFEVKKNDLVDFCMMIEYTSKEEVPIAVIHALDEQFLALMHNDTGFSNENDFRIRYTGNFQPSEFKFSAKGLLPIFRALPYETITFNFMAPHYKLTAKEDPGYLGVISALK